MLFCHIYIGSFAHGRVRHIAMYFPRYLFGSILTEFFALVIKYLGKYLTIRLTLSCAKEAIYMRQNSIPIFYILVVFPLPSPPREPDYRKLCYIVVFPPARIAVPHPPPHPPPNLTIWKFDIYSGLPARSDSCLPPPTEKNGYDSPLAAYK